MEFELLKSELIENVNIHNPCSSEYKKALYATNEAELLSVIYNNLSWCIERKCISHEYFSKFDKEIYIASGISNSGKENTGFANSGNSNSGNWNSGNWNSGNSNSGDSNSGYRNSGAFCTDINPKVWLFDQPTNIYVKDWEKSRPFKIMSNYLNFNFWINSSEMTESEKKEYPSHETTGGYLKRIEYKEGWANMWGNLSDEEKSEFTTLTNFDSKKFESITGIKI